MDENAVFQNPQTISQQPENIVPPPPPQNPPFDASSSQTQEPSIMPKIIKALIGVGILAILGFVIFALILPRFSKPKVENVTLTYWGLWEDNQVMQSIISDFERQNPNIKIEYVKQEPKQYRDRLTTRISQGTGPDIFRFHNTWLPMFLNTLVPLPSDTIKKEDFQNWYYPVVRKDLVKNGAIYGVPLEIDTLALFINTDSFKAASLEPPKTWDEFSRISRSLTVKDETGKIKNSGAALGAFDNITHAPDIISLLMLQNGADLKNFSSTLQSVNDALSFYTSFAKDEGAVWDQTLDPSILAFSKGNLSMFFGYSWDIFTIKSLNPNLNFAIYPVPSLPGRNMTIASYWAEGVSAKSKYQKQALIFIKFLSQKETQQKIFTEESKTRLFGEPYSRVDLAESLKSNTLLFPFVDQGKTAVSSYFAADTNDNGINSKMNNYLGNAVRSMLSQTSSQTAVDTLSKGVTQVLQQYSN
ncbi:MAG: sugar ABC transporter substrate-binding protein [Candidatus Levybacteria bacterium]|nr:sugar ABC transporter substrate-binding protein [Candidatus Levybacteria bacterium]